ncbi:pentapeptide repeat-containing protein [Streptomyces sp. NPDC059761]|uniref:pentapeptide repeat-containing protein n=1 Tax=Streptomyces sp. NPDC059761 TaxID=3346937 RepID=UPI00365FD0A3
MLGVAPEIYTRDPLSLIPALQDYVSRAPLGDFEQSDWITLHSDLMFYAAPRGYRYGGSFSTCATQTRWRSTKSGQLLRGTAGKMMSSGTRKGWNPRIAPANSEAAERLREWLAGDTGGLDVIGLDLSGADLSDADFSESWFSDSKLVDARLVATEFYRSDLQGADLTRADLTNASFVRANLDDAVLRNSVLDGADFVKASLYGVDASFARCHGTRFMGASLLDVNFCGADLSHAVVQENSFKVKLDADTVLTGLTGSLFGPVEFVGEGESLTIAGTELERWISGRGGDVRVLERRRPTGKQE